MDALISVINKLHDVFNTVGAEAMELPQIVVVGSQSSGKSSVIESIVGKDFLPRGTGIVTRRPLILQLINKNEDEISEDYATFLHTGDKIYTDFLAVRTEIERETERTLGKTKLISNDPITLKVYSSKYVDLTLVDLPGITKNPVEGQPADIEQQIRDLIGKYVENQNSIILAVTALTEDFVNSESIKLAREYDPDGERTLSVVTKLDLMDKGTNAYEVLRGGIIPIKLGIIGVINRSQQDILDNKPIQDAIKDEKAFFKKYYRNIAEEHGSVFLVSRLNNLLEKNIEKCLPYLKERVSKLMNEHRSALNSYGETMNDLYKKRKYLYGIIKKFAVFYCELINGSNQHLNTKSNQLRGGAIISNIFHLQLSRSLKSIYMYDLSDELMKIAILNANGIKTTFFVPYQTFESLARGRIEKFELPSLSCAKEVHVALKKAILDDCISHFKADFSRFPRLKDKIKDTVQKLIEKHSLNAEQRIKDLVESEKSYINCNHEDFKLDSIFNNADDKSDPIRNQGGDQLNAKKDPVREFKSMLKVRDQYTEEDEKESVRIMKELLENYLSIVCKTFKDQIPKKITRYLIDAMMEELEQDLFEQLYDQPEEQINALLFENDVTKLERKKNADMLQALEQANLIIEEINYLN